MNSRRLTGWPLKQRVLPYHAVGCIVHHGKFWLPMSASLIGRLGASAFRLFTTTVATSLAGSCFSPESAHRLFHHGIRGRGGTIFRATLPGGRSKRTHELTS